MSEKVYIGVDVSKAALDVRVEGGRAFVLDNAPKAIEKSLKRLVKENPGKALHVCYESTGVYGDALREACWDAKVTVSVLNAKRLRDWARSYGVLAKTDKIDARMICKYARERGAEPAVPPAQWLQSLRGLYRVREAFVQEKVVACGHLEQIGDKAMRKRLEREVARLDREIAGLEAEMVAVARSDARASDLMVRMTGVKGVGELTACVVIALVPELGTLGSKRVASLAGLAPHPDDSGKQSNPRHIREGRSDLRRHLYMPALAAIRHNKILRDFYTALKEKGKASKVALVAVMRRLIVLLEKIAGNPGFVPSAA